MANIIRITIGGNFAQLDAANGTFTLGVMDGNGDYHVVNMMNSKKEMRETVDKLLDDLNDIRWELANDYGALKGIKDAEELAEEPAEEEKEAE